MLQPGSSAAAAVKIGETKSAISRQKERARVDGNLANSTRAVCELPATLPSATKLLNSVRMFGLVGAPKNANGEEHPYYLLPGMGRANRRKRVKVFWASIITGLVF